MFWHKKHLLQELFAQHFPFQEHFFLSMMNKALDTVKQFFIVKIGANTELL